MMMQVEFDQITIVFSEDVMREFMNYQQSEYNMPEAGGILLGQVKDNYFYILKVSTPSKKDTFSRYRFTRDKRTAQKVIDQEFALSSHKTIYLGEWHTHPENYPSPSAQDINMIKEQFQNNILNEKLVLMVIVGLKSIYVSYFDGIKLSSLSLNLT